MSMDLSPWPEHERLKALFSYGILDTPNEAEFDALAEEIRSHFGTLCAAITFIDSDRQWMKAIAGPQVKEVPIGMAFCRYTIQQVDAFVIPNALNDPRFALSPYVTGPFQARSFIGQTFFSKDGMPIGTICICDNKVREFTTKDLLDLDLFVKKTQAVLEAREMNRKNSSGTASAVGPATLEGARVLVVDDEEDLNEIISDLFYDAGCEVFRASTAKAALIALATQSFDVIISDIRMPGMDGFQLLSQMKKLVVNPPLLFFMTGCLDEEPAEAIAKGACGLFTKPVDEIKMLEEVCEKLSQSPSRLQSIQATAEDGSETTSEAMQTSLLAS